MFKDNRSLAWILVLIWTLLLVIAAAYHPYFPGDVTIAKILQSLTGSDCGWARIITTSAGSPWKFLLLGLTFTISWLLGGWRAALFSLVSFAGMWVFGPWLNQLIARPRPSPAMIHV